MGLHKDGRLEDVECGSSGDVLRRGLRNGHDVKVSFAASSTFSFSFVSSINTMEVGITCIECFYSVSIHVRRTGSTK